MKLPEGKTLYAPRGRDQLGDQNTLADAIAASDANLLNDGGNALWIHEGKRIDVGLETLTEIVAKYLVTARPVDHGGKWTVAFDPVRPTQATLLPLLRESSLAQRLPKSKPHGLAWAQVQEVRLRHRRGEREDALAEIFGADVDAIKQIVRP
jgi:hypothetical protein